MADFLFLRPLWLLALLPTTILWIFLWRRTSDLGSLAELVEPHLLKHLLIHTNGKKHFRPIHALGLTWLFAILALSGPSWREAPAPFADEQAGLFILLKVSPTMEASDLAPSRLERARIKIADLLKERTAAATGLIAYNGSAHLILPLTRDDRLLQTMAASLNPAVMPVEGEDLTGAIRLAEDHFKRSGTSGSILMLTDNALAPAEFKASLPIQILALKPPEAPVPPTLQTAAKRLRARIIPLTHDNSDVRQIAARALSDFTSASGEEGNSHRHDSGLALLPFLALAQLIGFRKGWHS
jgi:Ca-activated chloride channel family protein